MYGSLLPVEKYHFFRDCFVTCAINTNKKTPELGFDFFDTTGDSHEDTVKTLFREPRSRLTLNNSEKNTIITTVSCLVESLINILTEKLNRL